LSSSVRSAEKDLADDKSTANFIICKEPSHGTLRFFTGNGCFFTSDEKVAEELAKRRKRVHVVDPAEVFLPDEAEIQARTIESNAISFVLKNLYQSFRESRAGNTPCSSHLRFLGTIN